MIEHDLSPEQRAELGDVQPLLARLEQYAVFGTRYGTIAGSYQRLCWKNSLANSLHLS